MSNRNYATDYVVHAHALGAACSNPRGRDRVASEVRSDVTCLRCLASLAKRDRAFQRKARGRFTLALPRHSTEPMLRGRWFIATCHGMPVPHNAGPVTCGPCLAARAIAREEGRDRPALLVVTVRS